MDKIAALYLAHLNPFTKAHEEIITNLTKKYVVYIFPVRFLLNGMEINTKSFPFSYELRKLMIREVFPNQDNVIVSPNYTFYSPFIRYLPPLFSPYSWQIREQVVNTISEKKFISYTGDSIERYTLKIYRFHPIKSKRLPISATFVKNLLYQEADMNTFQQQDTLNTINHSTNPDQTWEDKVPKQVVKVIRDNWSVIQNFSNIKDETLKIAGVKFPKKGFF
ncbi:MAG: hypothetical protein R3321_11705 [Nitrososphaeraceae archaeon]|nr:hypothetical protein [Nitrososphaeraceae archaeon]